MSRMDKKYRHVIKNAENRKRLKIALTVASLAVIFVVFADLTRPGITMTATDAAAEDTSEPAATALTDENTVSENEATTTESESF